MTAADEVITTVRMCLPCRVQWRARWGAQHGGVDERPCPRCKADAFYTMNAGDIGTAMHLQSHGLTQDDFETIPADGAGDPQP